MQWPKACSPWIERELSRDCWSQTCGSPGCRSYPSIVRYYFNNKKAFMYLCETTRNATLSNPSPNDEQDEVEWITDSAHSVPLVCDTGCMCVIYLRIRMQM